MDKLTSFMERLNVLWIPILGLSLMIFGIYLFIDISFMEDTGQMIRLKNIFLLIYSVGGKHSILLLFELTGLITLISGIKQIKNNY